MNPLFNRQMSLLFLLTSGVGQNKTGKNPDIGWSQSF